MPGTAVSISASGTMGPQGSVDYDITAPAWLPVKVEGTYNFVTMDGVQGEVFANTVRGDIVIKGGTGSITAKSVEGEVQVDGRTCRDEGVVIVEADATPTFRAVGDVRLLHFGPVEKRCR